MTITATTPSGSLPHPVILWIAQLRAWVFLILLIAFFEVWARTAEGISFVFNIYNIQSILVFATAPLLLALGQTFVIISSGIDLSLGFVMGLSSVIAAHAANYFAAQWGLPPFAAMLLAILSGTLIAVIPGLVNGLLIAHLQIPPFIGTLGMYGVARGAAYLFAGGMTVAIDNPMVLGDRQRPRLWRAGAGDHHRRCLPGHALHAVADPFRPAHLCVRREQGGGAPRRHQRQAPDGQDLSAVGGGGRPRRRDVHRPIHRRRGAGRRAAAARLRSPPSSSAGRACSAGRARSGERSPARWSSPSSSTDSSSSMSSRSGSSSPSARSSSCRCWSIRRSAT